MMICSSLATRGVGGSPPPIRRPELPTAPVRWVIHRPLGGTTPYIRRPPVDRRQTVRLPHAREAALSHWSLPGPWVGHPPPPAGTKQWPEACLFPTPPPVRNARRAPTCGWAHPRSIRVAAPAGFDTARGGSADGGGVIPTSPPKPGDHEVAHNFLFERRNATAHWKNTRSNAHIRAGSLSAGRPASCPIGRWLGAEIPTMASQGNLVGYVGHRAHAGPTPDPSGGVSTYTARRQWGFTLSIWARPSGGRPQRGGSSTRRGTASIDWPRSSTCKSRHRVCQAL